LVSLSDLFVGGSLGNRQGHYEAFFRAFDEQSREILCSVTRFWLGEIATGATRVSAIRAP